MTQLFLALLCVFSVSMRDAVAAELRREIPKATWEPIFFESINSLSRRAGWTPLRKGALSPGSTEVRIWIGFGLAPLEGFRLRRDGSKWTGHYVTEARGRSAPAPVTPKSGWEKLWNEVVRRGLLTLPDDSTLPNKLLVMDGVSCVVEINEGGGYRTYHYGNPQFQKWPEAKKIREIIRTIYREFGRP